MMKLQMLSKISYFADFCFASQVSFYNQIEFSVLFCFLSILL